jgi:hypothetical protein
MVRASAISLLERESATTLHSQFPGLGCAVARGRHPRGGEQTIGLKVSVCGVSILLHLAKRFHCRVDVTSPGQCLGAIDPEMI